MLSGRRIILGVTGSIAAYKAAELIRIFRGLGAQVTPVLTQNGSRFISALTLGTLAGRGALEDMFDRSLQDPMPHIDLSRWGEVIVVAPASANIIAKAANGIADDLLSTLLLSSRSPVIFCPAMNPAMWEHPATAGNTEVLRERGVIFAGPDSGPMACEDQGKGRLARLEKIVFETRKALDAREPFKDLKVLVTSGPTREPIDPVRFLSNGSSGKMGHALAEEAAVLGARVTLVTGPASAPDPQGVEIIKVNTAEEMFNAVMERFEDSRLIIKAAAVADFRPAVVFDQKRKKSQGLELDLEPTKDILAELGKRKGGRILVGFAAETRNVRAGALEKLKNKSLDAIVANPVSGEESALASDTNRAEIIFKNGSVTELPLMDKKLLARIILQELEPLLQ